MTPTRALLIAALTAPVTAVYAVLSVVNEVGTGPDGDIDGVTGRGR